MEVVEDTVHVVGLIHTCSIVQDSSPSRGPEKGSE